MARTRQIFSRNTRPSPKAAWASRAAASSESASPAATLTRASRAHRRPPGFHQNRIAGARRKAARSRQVAAIDPRHHRYARSIAIRRAATLSPSAATPRRRSHEDHSVVFGARANPAFGKKAVARMDGVGSASRGRGDYRVNIEIAARKSGGRNCRASSAAATCAAPASASE